MALSGLDAFERKLKAAEANASDDIAIAVAADFLHGGAPSFARIFDRRGFKLAAIQRASGEPWAVFVARAKAEAGETPGPCSMLIGGLPEDVVDVRSADRFLAAEPPRGAIVLPETPLHPSQVEALDLIRGNRRVVLVCGRRWGKSSSWSRSRSTGR